MTEPRIEETGHGSWTLAGDLSFSTVPGLMSVMNLGSADRKRISIDLSGVTRSDSAGLALLVEWLREAERLGKTIAFLNMPAQMQSIARVCGLAEMLRTDAVPAPPSAPDTPPAKARPVRQATARRRRRKAKR